MGGVESENGEKMGVGVERGEMGLGVEKEWLGDEKGGMGVRV